MGENRTVNLNLIYADADTISSGLISANKYVELDIQRRISRRLQIIYHTICVHLIHNVWDISRYICSTMGRKVGGEYAKEFHVE
jgi:hypothetical protein